MSTYFFLSYRGNVLLEHLVHKVGPLREQRVETPVVGEGHEHHADDGRVGRDLEQGHGSPGPRDDPVLQDVFQLLLGHQLVLGWIIRDEEEPGQQPEARHQGGHVED